MTSRELDGRVHWSTLKNIGRSPAHYIEALRARRDADKPNSAMLVGSATHAIVLDGDMPLTYDGIRRGKEWESFQAAHPNRLILSASEYKHATSAAAAVMRHDGAMRLLTGVRETRINWDRNGVPCSGTPDVVNAEFVVDLKTTASAEPNWFQRHAKQMGYVGQLAWYAYAAQRSRAAIVAVEAKAPYAVTLFMLNERVLEEGHKLCTKYLETFKQCEAAGTWPAYSEAPIEFESSEYDLIFDEEEAAQ